MWQCTANVKVYMAARALNKASDIIIVISKWEWQAMPTPSFSGCFKAPICLYELLPYRKEGLLPEKQVLNPHHLQLTMLKWTTVSVFTACQAITCNCSAADTVLPQLPPKSVHTTKAKPLQLSLPALILPKGGYSNHFQFREEFTTVKLVVILLWKGE